MTRNWETALRSLLLVATTVLLACAAPKAQAPATAAAVPQVAPPQSRQIDPFLGPLVSTDVATFKAACSQYLDLARQHIAQLKAASAKPPDPLDLIAGYETVDP